MLLILLVGFFFMPRVVWLLKADRARGTVIMTGHGNLGSAVGLSTYQVVQFVAGTDTIVFNGDTDLGLKGGSTVPVLYHAGEPHLAKIDLFDAIWMQTIIYFAGPFLVLVIIFFTPEIVPRRSSVVIDRKGISLRN